MRNGKQATTRRPSHWGRLSPRMTTAILSAVLIPGIVSQATQIFLVQEILATLFIVAVPFVAALLFSVCLIFLHAAIRFGVQFSRESAQAFSEHRKQLRTRNA